MNIKIYNKLVELAKRQFSSLKVLCCGTYTAQELADNKKEEKTIYSDGLSKDMVSVKEESFSCQFPLGEVFSVLGRFESALAIPSSRRAKFTKEIEMEDDASYIAFDVTASVIKSATECMNDDVIRPHFNNVCIDTTYQRLVSTDGRKMYVCPIQIVKGGRECKDGVYVIPASTWKSMKPGRIEIVGMLTPSGFLDPLKSVVRNNGHDYPILADLTYPNWHTAFVFSTRGFRILTNADLFRKSIKANHEPSLLIHGESDIIVQNEKSTSRVPCTQMGGSLQAYFFKDDLKLPSDWTGEILSLGERMAFRCANGATYLVCARTGRPDWYEWKEVRHSEEDMAQYLDIPTKCVPLAPRPSASLSYGNRFFLFYNAA